MRGPFTVIKRCWKVRWMRRSLVTVAAGAVLATGVSMASVAWIRGGATGHIFTESDVPEAPVALVLGTKVEADGTPSQFLTARLELAQRLFAAGKVRAILVSGDHMHADYDEPGAMRRWLVDHGVPETKVVQDHAGFDTYDSCARAKRIFGVSRLTVVTQSFYVPRAVTLCRHLGIEVNGVGDDTARRRDPGKWRISSTREYGACVKAVVDVLSGRDPVHLGRRETGVEDALRDG